MCRSRGKLQFHIHSVAPISHSMLQQEADTDRAEIARVAVDPKCARLAVPSPFAEFLRLLECIPNRRVLAEEPKDSSVHSTRVGILAIPQILEMFVATLVYVDF